LYFASPTTFSSPQIDFYLETHTYFNTLQYILSKDERRMPSIPVAGVWDDKGRLMNPDDLLGPPSPETVAQMRRIVDLYIDEVRDLRDVEGLEVCSG
jgi:hypothetical protein